LFGAVFVPFPAKANVFSDIFGTSDVLASVDQNYLKNSQSMDLLEANVSSASIFSDKKVKEKDEVDLSKEVKIVADSALSPSSSLMSPSSDIADSGEPISDQVSVYVVRKGDTIAQIAQMFNVSTNTILWANDLKKGEKLVEGDTLFILPVSGVSHTVLKGQTLKGIAKKYNVEVSDIARLNGIADDVKLVTGDELIIPDAEIVNIEAPKTKTVIVKSTTKTPVKVLVGYFINPVPNYKRKSQGLHGKNGVDLAAPTGTPIVASASGVVLLARKGYNGGYGNMVIIKHPNGTQTLYGHMVRLGTTTGASVNQGEVIGYVGSTGRSTGPHLHYEVNGARNSAQDL
jgi:LysM repeat protein